LLRISLIVVWQLLLHFAHTRASRSHSTSPGGGALLGRNDLSTVTDGPKTGTIVHPSGATGSFTLSPVRHGRSQTYRLCRGDPSTSTYAVYPYKYDTYSLTNKTLSGPGIASLSWSYDYGPDNGSWEGCVGCTETVTTSVTDPKGDVARYTYGNRHRQTEGRLVSVDTDGLRTVTMRYRDAAAGPYPLTHGTGEQLRGDSEMNAKYTPVDRRVTTQQGVDFTWQATSFDTKARPTVVTRSSTLGFSRTETTAYFDQEAKWVLGQIQSLTESATGKIMTATDYDPTTAMPLNVRRYGYLDQSYTYNTDGTLATRKDGLNQTTTYTNYKRGLAQNVTYADSATESAVVNDLGLITSVTRQIAAGSTAMTGYGYDAMGRLASITHPGSDSVAWNQTIISFSQMSGQEFDLPAGHWRQTVTTGKR
jgi:YD repeat-containing protein